MRPVEPLGHVRASSSLTNPHPGGRAQLGRCKVTQVILHWVVSPEPPPIPNPIRAMQVRDSGRKEQLIGQVSLKSLDFKP